MLIPVVLSKHYVLAQCITVRILRMLAADEGTAVTLGPVECEMSFI